MHLLDYNYICKFDYISILCLMPFQIQQLTRRTEMQPKLSDGITVMLLFTATPMVLQHFNMEGRKGKKSLPAAVADSITRKHPTLLSNHIFSTANPFTESSLSR
jgi:hypothetical protein